MEEQQLILYSLKCCLSFMIELGCFFIKATSVLSAPYERPDFETILDFKVREMNFRAYSPSIKLRTHWNGYSTYEP